MESLDDYISTREASDRYGLSKEHIARMLKAGLLKGKKIGHDWLVHEPSLRKHTKQMNSLGKKKFGLRRGA